MIAERGSEAVQSEMKVKKKSLALWGSRCWSLQALSMVYMGLAIPLFTANYLNNKGNW